MSTTSTLPASLLAVVEGNHANPHEVLGRHGDVVRIWQPGIGRMVRILRHPAPVYAVAWGRDGARLYTGAKDGVLRTHPLSPLILPSVTRELVLEIAAERHMPVREEAFSERELFHLDELFVSGTTTDVTAIIEVDGRRIGSGVPGPVTRALYAGLQSRLYAGAAVAQR